MAIQYKRILLKVSGEALSGPKGTGFDEETIASICAGIKAAHDLGAQIGIVVGGGNFWRGRSSGKMDRMDADKIGMLATVMNALAVKDALRQQGVPAVVMTSSFMPQVAEVFTSDKAIAALESGKIVVFGGGTGNPIFSTDTASALRALEIGADAGRHGLHRRHPMPRQQPAYPGVRPGQARQHRQGPAGRGRRHAGQRVSRNFYKVSRKIHNIPLY